jgi:hypothetical protein
MDKVLGGWATMWKYQQSGSPADLAALNNYGRETSAGGGPAALASPQEGPAATPISGSPAAIPTNPSTRAAGEGAIAPVPQRKALLGG